jgi:antitoxin ParD1/3/4
MKLARGERRLRIKVKSTVTLRHGHRPRRYPLQASLLSEELAMNVSLTPELETYIQAKVTSGRYSSASEVMREALRLLQDHDQLQAIKLEALRKEIAIGIEQADRGEFSPLDIEETIAKARARNAKPESSSA